MGKWSHLKSTLPPLPDPDPKHAELVEKTKEGLSKKHETIASIVDFYTTVRNKKDEIKITLSAVQIMIDAAENIIKDRYEAQGLTKMTLESGETISVSPEPHAIVIDQALMVEWAKEEGLESKLTIPWMTLNSHLKGLLSDGKKEQPGVKAYIRTKVLFRRND